VTVNPFRAEQATVLVAEVKNGWQTGCLSGLGALWGCLPRVCGGGDGCTSGDAQLWGCARAVMVSLGGKHLGQSVYI